jgi:hypothetical protein
MKGQERERKMCRLMTTVCTEAARDEERICKENSVNLKVMDPYIVV